MNENNLNSKNHHYVFMLFLLIDQVFLLLQDNANYLHNFQSLTDLLEYHVSYYVLICMLVLCI